MHKQTTSAVRKAKAPSTSAKSLPQEYFVSSETFAKEQEKIFAKHWLLVGHQSQLKKSGDFFLATIAGESLIVVRDQPPTREATASQGSQRGEIRAFYNVCRHRGTRLKEDPCGHASAIQCPYHAWTYGLDGRLIGAPHMNEVRGFDKAHYSLHPVNLEVWDGFIFVNLTKKKNGKPRPAFGQNLRRGEQSEAATGRDGFVSLESWFAPLKEKFAHWNTSILHPAKRIEYDVKANWKLMFENYSECYHCPGVHPTLSKISPYDSAENDLREGPFLGGFMKINQGKSLTMSGNACALQIDQKQDKEQEQEGKNRVWYYSIFPNMLLSMHPEYVMVHQLWPECYLRKMRWRAAENVQRSTSNAQLFNDQGGFAAA